MQNRGLALDYIVRAGKRIYALEALFEQESWADVVRESQEVVELSLKGLLRYSNLEVPRVHDVSNILDEERKILPNVVQKDVDQLIEISRRLRRDRELAFYGSEDLTPSEFYKKKDAEEAISQARWVVATLTKVIIV